MNSAAPFEMPLELPEGYVAVPLNTSAVAANLEIAALVRSQPDEVGGHLVALHDLLDGQVFLGCVIDRGGRVLRWLEIWVQNIDGLGGSVQASRDALSNAVLDRRWSRHFEALSAIDSGGVIVTEWELKHPLPLVLDLKACKAVNLVDGASAEQWRLCEDDALLVKHGLPPYGTSMARYLQVKKSNGEFSFARVNREAPAKDGVGSVNDIVKAMGSQTIAINAGGGLMMVRAYSPIGVEQFIDLLGGGEWTGLRHGRTTLKWKNAAASNQSIRNIAAGGSLFLDRHGRWGRLVESLHLKLRMLSDMVGLVRGLTARTQTPLLNVTPETFQIRMNESGGTGAGAGLPYLWKFNTALNDPGQAIALPIQSSEVQHFMRCGSSGMSIYQPESAAHMIHSRGAMRIRQVLPDVGGAIIVEGTLTTQERIKSARNDLLWIRLNLADRRIDLYSRLETDAALANGEVRFRTVPQRLDESISKALRAAEGVPIADTTFEIIPLLSSPCDLYSLAIMAVRTLLVNPENSLPKAVDEVMSLGRQLGAEFDGGVSLRLRMQSILSADKRWLTSLGPHRLAQEALAPAEVLDLIPLDLWCDVLGLIVQMLPGLGRDSFCVDLGDAQPGGLHKVFDKALADLEGLLIRTRSLIVIDWRFNREVHSVIRRYATGLTGEAMSKR